MFFSVWPLQAILFQFLFLLITIAIEAFIMHRRLRLSRKTSVEYALSLNLLSIVLTWTIFFYVEQLVPPKLRAEIISYIFFNKFFVDTRAGVVPTDFLLTLFITFVGTFIIELKALDGLEFLLEVPQRDEGMAQKTLRRPVLGVPDINKIFSKETPSKATVILLANICSFGIICLISFILSI